MIAATSVGACGDDGSTTGTQPGPLTFVMDLSADLHDPHTSTTSRTRASASTPTAPDLAGFPSLPGATVADLVGEATSTRLPFFPSRSCTSTGP
jgi:hypothetical protein